MSGKAKKVKKAAKPVESVVDKVSAVFDAEIAYWSRKPQGGLLFLTDEETRRTAVVSALRRAKSKVLREVFGRRRSK